MVRKEAALSVTSAASVSGTISRLEDLERVCLLMATDWILVSDLLRPDAAELRLLSAESRFLPPLPRLLDNLPLVRPSHPANRLSSDLAETGDGLFCESER